MIVDRKSRFGTRRFHTSWNNSIIILRVHCDCLSTHNRYNVFVYNILIYVIICVCAVNVYYVIRSEIEGLVYSNDQIIIILHYDKRTITSLLYNMYLYIYSLRFDDSWLRETDRIVENPLWPHGHHNNSTRRWKGQVM